MNRAAKYRAFLEKDKELDRKIWLVIYLFIAFCLGGTVCSIMVKDKIAVSPEEIEYRNAVSESTQHSPGIRP